MQYLEIGVYILGATALALLASAGISFENKATVVASIAAAGAAYISQLATTHSYQKPSWPAAIISLTAMAASLSSWAYGLYIL